MNHLHDSGKRCSKQRHSRRQSTRYIGRITLVALACLTLCSVQVAAQSTGADAAKPHRSVYRKLTRG